MASGRKKLNEEKQFYDSLDKNNSRTCSCQALILLLASLFIVSTVFTYVITKKMNTSIKMPGLFSFNKRLEKASVITIFETDLQTRINGNLGKTIPLSEKKVEITQNGVTLEGKYMKKTVYVTATPQIVNQKIAFKDIKVKDDSGLASHLVPTFVTEGIGKIFAKSINDMTDYRITDLTLKDGSIDLTVY